VHPKTTLLWKIHDGSIVEQRSNASNLTMLLSSSSCVRSLTREIAGQAIQLEALDRLTNRLA
jgi:hypothetical protein